MAQVMQATCPGCKTVLRIPAEWANQVTRCKQCGTTFQLKVRPAPPPLPGASTRTPAPAPRPRKASTPPPPPPRGVKKATPVASVPKAKPARSTDPFDFTGGETDDSGSLVRPARRGGGSGPWVGLLLMVALIGLVAGLGYAFWPKIEKAINEKHQKALAATAADPDEEDAPKVAPKKDGDKPKNEDPPKPKEDAPKNKDKDATTPKDKDKPVVTNKDGTTPKDKATPKDKDKVAVVKDKDKTAPKDKDKVVVKDKDKTPKDKDKVVVAKDKDKTPPPVGKGPFPRRALIVSVHNYLYANPVMPGMGGRAISGSANPPVAGLVPALVTHLNIPNNQVFHVSDAAVKNPLPPLKNVIEQSVNSFLKTSRDQDRVMLFFVGHTKEIEDKAYLVPLEGDFKDVSTLIPLDWVYQQLRECKARQKILVIDGNRFNAAQGEERPSSGEMGAKFEAALKAPPEGVEVWSACSATQQSHEFDGAPLGVFLDALRTCLAPPKGEKGAMEGTIQRHEDPIPLDRLHAAVAERVANRVEKRKVKQAPFIAGKAAAEGAAYNRDAAPAQEPAFPAFEPKSQEVVKEVLAEISLPPIKSNSTAGADLNFGSLPPFPADALKKYEGAMPEDSKLRKAVRAARVALWAVSPATAPAELQGDVTALRTKGKIKDIGTIMRDRYAHPGSNENRFKDERLSEAKEMARVMSVLKDALDELKAAADELGEAPMRWQAHYVYVSARLQAQLVYLEEFESLLGQIRKEFPPYDASVNSGWRMAAKDKPSDSEAKRILKDVRKGYAELAKKHKGTPWEVLGKREELTALGLEWQAY